MPPGTQVQGQKTASAVGKPAASALRVGSDPAGPVEAALEADCTETDSGNRDQTDTPRPRIPRFSDFFGFCDVQDTLDHARRRQTTAVRIFLDHFHQLCRLALLPASGNSTLVMLVETLVVKLVET